MTFLARGIRQIVRRLVDWFCLESRVRFTIDLPTAATPVSTLHIRMLAIRPVRELLADLKPSKGNFPPRGHYIIVCAS